MSGYIFFFDFIIFERTEGMKMRPAWCLLSFNTHNISFVSNLSCNLTFFGFVGFFFSPPLFFLIKMDCLFIWCTSSLMQWIVWIPRAPTTASVWTGSATASQAGGGSTASCPGPSARTSATVTGPSSPTRGCAAVIPTGWDLTVPWVSLGVQKKKTTKKYKHLMSCFVRYGLDS